MKMSIIVESTFKTDIITIAGLVFSTAHGRKLSHEKNTDLRKYGFRTQNGFNIGQSV